METASIIVLAVLIAFSPPSFFFSFLKQKLINMRRTGTLIFYLLFFLLSALPQSYSQDISGFWQGVLQQGGGRLSFGLDLDQQENQISGTRFIKGGPTAFAIFGIQGTINNASFSYQSNNVINEIRPSGGFWCSLGGTLTYDSIENTLNGNWCPNNLSLIHI